MKKTLIAATALMILGAPLAFAANSTTMTPLPNAKPAVTQTHKIAAASPSARCTTLENQFSKVESAHKSMPVYKDAVRLRDEGRNMCTANKATEGIGKLEQALKLLGVKPAANS
jgi:curli biogenesis system outer membrane secretion channel CsgG